VAASWTVRSRRRKNSGGPWAPSHERRCYFVFDLGTPSLTAAAPRKQTHHLTQTYKRRYMDITQLILDDHSSSVVRLCRILEQVGG